MAYNNNSRNNNRSNYNNNNNQNNNTKHSGAKLGTSKKGSQFLSSWMYRKSMGLTSLIASPNSDGEVYKDKYVKWTGKLTNKRNLTVQTVSILQNIETKKFYITELNICISPNGGRGGFMGFITKN